MLATPLVIHVIIPLAAAPAPVVAVSPVEQWLAPGGVVGVLGGLLYAVAKVWRDGRSQDVSTARTRADEAERERDEVRDELKRQLEDMREESRAFREQAQHDTEELRTEVRRLQREIRDLRTSHDVEMRERERRHHDEIEALQGRLVRQTAVAWRLRETLAQHGIAMPPDLDPDRPEVRPRLDVASGITDEDEDFGP